MSGVPATQRILVVDDQALNTDYYRSHLTSAGFSVITANNGREGVELFNTERPDLVLLDVVMPGMDGYEAARLMRSDPASRHIPIIFITAVQPDTPGKLNALEQYATDYITKPVNDAEIVSRINASLRMKRLFDELQATKSRSEAGDNKYRNILENMEEGYFEADLNGNLVFFNESVVRILRIPRDKLPGMNSREYMTIRTDKKKSEIFKEIYRSGKASDFFDCEIIRGDGSIAILEVSAGLLRDESGAVTGFNGVARDVTEKKKAEREILIKSYAIEKSMNAIAITEPGGGFSFVNNSFLTMWGFADADQLLGKTILQCCHPDTHEDLLNVFEVLEEIGSWVGELYLKRTDGSSIYTILSASMIKNEKQDTIGIILSFVDITLRKKVDYALQEKHRIISKRNKEIERDLKVAQITLRDIMNQQVPRLDAMAIDFRYNPMEKLGGDFFCFYPFLKDSFGIFICDVSGHGVASSLYLSLLKSITDRLSVKHGQTPVRFITQLNAELYGRMSSYFITGIYGLFSRQKKSGEFVFSYTNGGHPGPIVARRQGDIALHMGKSTLIGISDDIAFDSTTIRLSPGDRMYLYTDGIPETANRQKDMLGYDDALLELFRTNAGESLGEKLNNIMKKIVEFRDGADITDDTLVIGFEVK